MANHASGRGQRNLAICLALTAGYIDGYGLLVLGTFVSFMSGNTTTAGVRVGQGDVLAAVAPAVSIGFFVAGSFVANLVAESGARHARRLLSGAIAGLFVLVLALGHDGAASNASIAALAFGMGMVNPMLSRIGAVPVSLTFMTGTLSRIGGHLALAARKAPVAGAEGPWDGHLHRAGLSAMLWGAFVGGAALAGVVASVSQTFALAPGIAAMLALAVCAPPAPTDPGA